MLRAHLSPVGRLCEAELTKRSTSEVGLGATVVGVSLLREIKNLLAGDVVSGEKYGWPKGVPVSPGNGKN